MNAHALAALLVVAANVIIFVAAGQVRGGIAPVSWASFYEATTIWHRLLIAGCIYAAIIGPFTFAFTISPATASLTQAVMGALMVLGLAVATGGKALTLPMLASTGAVAVSSLWVAWAVMQAPQRIATAAVTVPSTEAEDPQ